MKKLIVLIAVSCLAKISFGQNNCSVEVTGLKSNTGKCLFYIYKSKKGFPTDTKNAMSSESATIQNGKCTVSFKDLPNGEYAISVIHDENGNGKMDSNFIGMPKEGIGTSNNAKSSFGPPSFEESKFKMEGKIIQLQIKIKYL